MSRYNPDLNRPEGRTPRIPFGHSTIYVPIDNSGDSVAASYGHILPCHVYKPINYRANNITLWLHGTARTDMRPWSIGVKNRSDQYGLLSISPVFDDVQYPTTIRYHRGRIQNPSDTAQLLPKSGWVIAALNNIIQRVVSLEDWIGEKPKVRLYGHSAGGEIMSRIAAFWSDVIPGARLICANPNITTFPYFDQDFHFGHGNLPDTVTNMDRLRRSLAAEFVIHAGSSDTVDGLLPDSPDAQMQGANRFERMQNLFATAQATAAANDWPCNWEYYEATGVGHTSTGMINNSSWLPAFFGG